MGISYLKRINENYKGISNHGYSRITNDVRRCDRLSTIEICLLEELINLCNVKKKSTVKIEKWKLEKILKVKERRVSQVSKEMIDKGILIDFESDGSIKGWYHFTLCDNISINPYIVLSETEFMILNELSPKTKTDFKLMHKLIGNIKNGNQNELIQRFKLGIEENAHTKYHIYLKEMLDTEGVKFKENSKMKLQKEVDEHLLKMEAIARGEGILDNDTDLPRQAVRRGRRGR